MRTMTMQRLGWELPDDAATAPPSTRQIVGDFRMQVLQLSYVTAVPWVQSLQCEIVTLLT